MRLSRVGGFRSEEIAAWARCHLEPGTVVVSDALGCFAAVQCAGCFHQPFVTGSGPASARHPALTWVNTILGNIKRSLHGTYHHLSSKHLPRYLAEFSYRFNRRFSLREMFPRLAFVALRTAPMPYRVLKLLRTIPERMKLVRNQDSTWRCPSLALQKPDRLHAAFRRQGTVREKHPVCRRTISKQQGVDRRAQPIGIGGSNHRAVALLLLELVNHHHEIGKGRFTRVRAQTDIAQHSINDNVVAHAERTHRQQALDAPTPDRDRGFIEDRDHVLRPLRQLLTYQPTEVGAGIVPDAQLEPPGGNLLVDQVLCPAFERRCRNQPVSVARRSDNRHIERREAPGSVSPLAQELRQPFQQPSRLRRVDERQPKRPWDGWDRA